MLISGKRRLLSIMSLCDKSEVNETINIAIVAYKCTTKLHILKNISLKKLFFQL